MVTKYKLQFSDDGSSFLFYKRQGESSDTVLWQDILSRYNCYSIFKTSITFFTIRTHRKLVNNFFFRISSKIFSNYDSQNEGQGTSRTFVLLFKGLFMISHRKPPLRNFGNPLGKWDKDKYDIHVTEGMWMQVTKFIKDFKLCPYKANRVVKTYLAEETIRKTNCMPFGCSPLCILLGFRRQYRSWHRCLSPSISTNHGTFLTDKANSMAKPHLYEAGALHLSRYFN